MIRRHPEDANYIDTYANILYKSGKKKLAIQWQEKAFAMASNADDDYLIKSLGDNLQKMKNNEPTWIKPLDQE